jgi:hypothetical protein
LAVGGAPNPLIASWMVEKWVLATELMNYLRRSKRGKAFLTRLKVDATGREDETLSEGSLLIAVSGVDLRVLAQTALYSSLFLYSLQFTFHALNLMLAPYWLYRNRSRP